MSCQGFGLDWTSRAAVRATLTVSDLLLDDEFLGGLRRRQRLDLGLKRQLLLLLLQEQACLLLSLDLLLSLLLFARLVAVLVAARVLALVPASTADARATHDSDRHLDVAAVLFVDRLGLLQPLDLEVERVNLLHQLALSRPRLHCDPLQVVWQLNALVVRQV